MSQVNVKIIGKGIEVTEGMRNYTEEALKKLTNFFTDELSFEVKLTIEKELQTVELTAKNENVLRVKKTTTDYYESLNKCISLMKNQIVKHNKKMKNINRNEKFELTHEHLSDYEIKKAKKQDDQAISKEKEVMLIAMSDENAMMQMEMLGHDFFLYLDPIENNVRVLYKREDGKSLGVIQTKKI